MGDGKENIAYLAFGLLGMLGDEGLDVLVDGGVGNEGLLSWEKMEEGRGISSPFCLKCECKADFRLLSSFSIRVVDWKTEVMMLRHF